MKRIDFLNEIKGLSKEALLEKERSLGEEHMKLRFRKASQVLSNAHHLALVRRNIARVKTEIRSRELQGQR